MDTTLTCSTVSLFTGLTVTIFPTQTILHGTTVVKDIVTFGTFYTSQGLGLLTSFNYTLTSFKSKVRKTVSALTSLISDTSSFHLFASSLRSQVKSTFTSNTTIVIVSFAVANNAMTIRQGEKVMALLTDMIDFFFASND